MPAAVLWICCWAYLNCAGWMLAALHQINTAGYIVVVLVGMGFALAWLKKHPPAFPSAKFFRRFRYPLPAIFLLLAVLIFVGGVLYAPTNYDALTYRLPRMLNWLVAGKWFWIPTVNERLNYSAPAWEWTAMPLLALTRSDRALFLINWLGFLLMPGLIFSVFLRLGVARRVTWTWMWILPLTYGYATQAGGIGNDLTGAVFCLLSVYFGLRARQSGRPADIWLCLFAAALMTGVKMSNAPLALPCVVAVWPALAQLRRHLVSSLFLAGAAAVISAAPTMALNQIHTGSWTGDPNNQYQMQLKNPAAALLGNSLLVAEEALMPPVLPAARKASDELQRRIPDSWSQLLKRDFPRFYMARLIELPSEEGAGFGLGASLLLLAGMAGTLWKLSPQAAHRHFRFRLPLVAVAAWAAGLVYLLKMGSEAAARLMLPYYPLMLLPFLLLPGQNYLLRFRAIRVLAILAALSVLPAVILSPLRPLWPAQAVCETSAAKHPGNPSLQRMALVYSAYAHRNDLLASVREELPPDVRQIGFIAGLNDTDYSLWRPFGWHQVIDLGCDADQFLHQPDQIEWLVVKEDAWPEIYNVPLAEWEKTNRFQVVFSTNLVELVSWGGERWSLLHKEK